MALRAVAFALICVAALATPAARGPADPAREFLAGAFGVGASDMARIASGRVYSRTLPVEHDREVATLGIVRIATEPQRYVDLLADIAKFKRDDKILQIGTFGTPPAPGNLADLTLDDDDIRSLRDCRVGKCGVQLSAGAINRFRTEVNWKANNAPEQATALLRRILADYVADYLASGPTAAMEYADTATRLSLSDEFTSLIAADTSTWPRVANLRHHLLRFPSAKAEGAKDLVYWSKERVHRRPVVSVTHVAIVPGERNSAVQYAIASRQIYAMHYFDVSLGVTLLIPDETVSPAATYVVYLNRSRIDLFGGLWGGLARSVVKGKARSLVAEQLERLRETLE
jgi:hypothetical protein